VIALKYTSDKFQLAQFIQKYSIIIYA